MEYSIFARSFIKLYYGMNLSNIKSNNELIIESENKTNSDSDSSNNLDNEEGIKKKLSATVILKILCSYNLVVAFPNLFLAYKYLCTIPTTSAASKRSFSKVKLIKIRLRTTMIQSRLESLMLLSCEKNIVLNPEDILNKYAFTSSVLQKELLFK